MISKIIFVKNFCKKKVPKGTINLLERDRERNFGGNAPKKFFLYD